MIITLEEALASGRGAERPFTCFEAQHSHPTASVNVLKGFWFCYSCGAKGAVDSKRVPSIEELFAMLEPEKAVRSYPLSWLTTFDAVGYWHERFPDWLCRMQRLGEDPWTAEGTYPVHTPGGRLAGVCRRALTEGPWPKYRYPSAWSASRTLFGSFGVFRPHRVISLHEGAADAMALQEGGVTAFATYGSGLHDPQLELVVQMRPELVLLGFDNDDAGRKATEAAVEALDPHTRVGVIDWGEFKDPAEAPLEARLDAAISAVPEDFDVLGVWDGWESASHAQQTYFAKEIHA